MRFDETAKIIKKTATELSQQYSDRKTEISLWLYKFGFKRPFTLNKDYSINLHGDIELSCPAGDKLGKSIVFATVEGDFYCGGLNLTSLKGCPAFVTGDFICNGNRLTSLEYCPQKIGGVFACEDNDDLTDILRHIFTANFSCDQFIGPIPNDTDEGILFNDIINIHLKTKDILSCVDALLDAGFYKYCKEFTK